MSEVRHVGAARGTESGSGPSHAQGHAREDHAFQATRADLLRRVGRSAESQVAYDRAIELADNAAEIVLLTRRRDQLSGG